MGELGLRLGTARGAENTRNREKHRTEREVSGKENEGGGQGDQKS